MTRVTFQRALLALSFEPVISRAFRALPDGELRVLGEWVAEHDPYGEMEAVVEALRRIPGATADPVPHVVHQLWCARRQAAWTSGDAEPPNTRVEGAAFVEETRGHATVVVAPMTLAMPDALHAIRTVMADRPCVVFGEDVPSGMLPGHIEVVGGHVPDAAARVAQVLRAGGVFCTYPDFVYDGRRVSEIPLFGTRRPISSGYLRLACDDDTMLLPIVCRVEGDGVTVCADEPVHVRRDASIDTQEAMEAAGRTVAQLLEELISRAPHQWRLLPTLTFESPQMAA